MPRHKDLKRAVRARMKKTGESYTTARANLIAKRPPQAKSASPTKSSSVKSSPATTQRSPKPSEFDALAGMSSEAVQAKTGKTWREWVAALDAVGASEMSHRDIARHVGDSYDVSGWWAQSITVGYERIRGLREVGQRRGGSYDANKSKTFSVPIDRLYKAFSTKRVRERWLDDATPTIRTSQVNRSMRVTWPDGTTVNVWFTEKGPAKSQVAIQHGGLADKKDVARRKEYWAGRFATLGKLLKD